MDIFKPKCLICDIPNTVIDAPIIATLCIISVLSPADVRKIMGSWLFDGVDDDDHKDEKGENGERSPNKRPHVAHGMA